MTSIKAKIGGWLQRAGRVFTGDLISSQAQANLNFADRQDQLALDVAALGSKLDELNLRASFALNRDLQQIIHQRQQSHANPLTRFGRKCFSQADEDGITLEILRRLGIENGSYCEFGVGGGLENNTLILAAMGWRGFWVGGEDLAFDYAKATRFAYHKAWVTAENAVELYRQGCASLSFENADVVSLDLDGNDLYLCDALLKSGACPQLFIVEYNGRFIPPVRFCIDYDPAHQWAGDDYHGASLASFCDMFLSHGYTLICCNAASGANAFFVRDTDADKFPEVPDDMAQIYAEPHFHLYTQYGHPQSVRAVELLINRE